MKTIPPESKPVMQRVGRLTRLWRMFTAAPDARILRWCLTSDAGRMVDCFLAWHAGEDSELADLCLALPIPFEKPERYAAQLVQHLADEFKVADKQLGAMELPTGWRPDPESKQPGGADDPQRLITALASIHKHYAEYVDHVAVALTPPAVVDPDQWTRWLDRLAKVSYWPAPVRVLVLDWLPETRLDGWAKSYDKRVLTQKPALDPDGLPLEILSRVRGRGPGFEFRRLFVQLGAAAAAGNIRRVLTIADRADALARGQGWPSLATAVQMTVAAAYAAAGKSNESTDTYRKALAVARTAATTDPARMPTLITSNLALAGSLVGQGNYDEARKNYLEAVKLADETGDTFAAFESRRMASYCSEQLNDHTGALRMAREAMRLLERLPAEQRMQGTGPHLAARMTELAGRPELAQQARDVERLCSTTLRGDWRSAAGGASQMKKDAAS